MERLVANVSTRSGAGAAGAGGRNVSSNDTSSVAFCREWDDAQDVLFQAANLFYAASFFVPHTFRCSILVTRLLLCFGYVMLVFWAVSNICAPDVFAWNTLLIIIHLVHLVYLSYQFFPACIRHHLMDVYAKLFLPLGVSRDVFVQLTKDSCVHYLHAGQEYFADWHINANLPNQRILSILLSGKLQVTFGTTLLHHIYPFEFVDSPEWYMQHAFPSNANASLPQVLITALNHCTLLYWHCDTLKQLTGSNHELAFILDCLIGKDISHKLYSVAENVDAEKLPFDLSVRSWKPKVPFDPWQKELLRSQSVDAVYTCKQGQVRSFNWHRNQVRLTWRNRYEKLVPSPAEMPSSRRTWKRTRSRRSERPRELYKVEDIELQYDEDDHLFDGDAASPRTLYADVSPSREDKGSLSDCTYSPQSMSMLRAQPHWSKVKFETYV